MAEASFILPTAEMMPRASGTPATPANTAAEGIFAGMLAQRLQPQPGVGGQAGPAASSVATLDAVAKQTPRVAANSGQASPPSGKALPLSADAAGGDSVDSDLAESQRPILTEGDSPLLIDGAPMRLAQLLPGGLTQESAQAGALVGTQGSAQGLTQDNTQSTATDPLLAAADDVIDTASQALLAAGVASAAPLANPNATAAALNSTATPNPNETSAALNRSQTAAELQLAKLLDRQANTAREAVQTMAQGGARQPAASLGLNANYATGEALRSNNATLAVEQTMRGRAVEAPANQALTGDSLSRQFQLQIDRLLAGSRAGVTSAASPTSLFSAPATESLAGTAVDASLSSLLPSFTTDTRGTAPLGLLAGISVPVTTPVGQPAWSSDLGQRMVWLANQEIREAQLQLNPRNLGPIDVRIVYSDSQQVSVSFNAQNPAAREALDAALPRLREMFEQQGLSLGDANVSQESFAGQQQGTEGRDEFSAHAHAENAKHSADSLENDAPLRPPPVILGSGLLDTFA